MSRGGDLYEIVDDAPELDAPVLVYWFNGFVDAGSAGSGLVDTLLSELDHQVIARFDADRLVDYRARRPQMLFAEGAFQDYTEPELVLHLVRDDGGSPFLLLTGPEPDVMWEAFAEAVIELIDRFGVRLSVGVHGIPNPVPHTRPIGVIAHSTRPGLVPDEQRLGAELRVPGSASALLEYRLGRAGHDGVGFVARVPHYLADSDYPQSSLALLHSVSSATGLLLPTGDLLELSERTDELVQEQVENNDQVARVVQALESQYDAFAGGDSRGNLMAEQRAIPSAEEIGAELERYLAELDEPDDNVAGPDA